MQKIEVIYPDRVRIDLKHWKGGPEGGKSVALGKETSVSPHETFQMASEELYHELATQLRVLFARGPGEAAQAPTTAPEAVGDEQIDEPPAPPEDPSWCDIHKVNMKMRSWGGYSHKMGEQWCQGHWCLEHKQPFKKTKKGGVWLHAYEDRDTGETLWCREDGELEEIQS